MAKLSQKQKFFVEAYLANPNATAAALSAGYSKKTAYSQGQRLLKHVEISKLVKNRVESTIITANEILAGIKEIAVSGEKDADRLKAYELLGKHLAMWTDRTAHEGFVQIEVKYSDPFSDDDE